MSDRDSNSFGWFIAGLGLGALLGVLYAPKSGRETRDLLMRSAEDGRDMVLTRGRQARESVDEWVDRGRDVLNRQKDSLTAAVEAGRQAYRDASDTPTTGKKG